MKFLPATTWLLEDEDAWELQERHLPRPDSRGVNRYQTIGVIRNDTQAMFTTDLGPAKNFKNDGFRILSHHKDERTGKGVCDRTVTELKELADQFREEPRIHPNVEPLPLAQWHEEYMEGLKKRLVKGPYKQFGYGQ